MRSSICHRAYSERSPSLTEDVSTSLRYRGTVLQPFPCVQLTSLKTEERATYAGNTKSTVTRDIRLVRILYLPGVARLIGNQFVCVACQQCMCRNIILQAQCTPAVTRSLLKWTLIIPPDTVLGN